MREEYELEVLEKNEKTLEKGGRVVYNGGKW